MTCDLLSAADGRRDEGGGQDRGQSRRQGQAARRARRGRRAGPGQGPGQGPGPVGKSYRIEQEKRTRAAARRDGREWWRERKPRKVDVGRWDVDVFAVVEAANARTTPTTKEEAVTSGAPRLPVRADDMVTQEIDVFV